VRALRFSPPFIAPSQRYCLVCTAILDGLADGSPGYPIYRNHSNVYPCGLRPGLPDAVCKRGLVHFDKILTTYLDNVMCERRMSDREDHGEVLSQDNGEYQPADIFFRYR